MDNYIDLKPFRFWCQKVLPLVYDDSLSYYELLCKVVDYLNKTMQNVETLHGDYEKLQSNLYTAYEKLQSNLYTAYEKLKSYVNNYFTSLDVQEEINNKLDEMATSGELYEIIRRYTDPILNEQNEKIDVLKSRMDTFAKLPDGSTAGNAELADIRVGYNGVVYHSAGDAVRNQVSELNEDLVDVNSYFETLTKDYDNICSIIRNNTTNNVIGNRVSGVRQFFDFGENVTLTKIKANIKSDNNGTVVCEIASLDGKIISSKQQALGTEYSNVQFDFKNLVVKEPISVSLYMKNNTLLSYASFGTPFKNPSFVYVFPDGTTKLAFKFGQDPFNDAFSNDNKQCIVLFFDYSVEKIETVKESILESIDETLLISGKSADAKVVGDKFKALENINQEHIIYVSLNGNDENGNGTEENPFATIFHANETITDNSETNRYRIIVKKGTYTDLQTKYAGIDGTYYQGVTCKSYVTYESEDTSRPDLCVLEWDGSVGYTKPVTNANCTNKCLFHIKDNSQAVYIKGFTFKSKNTRYCMHIETVGSTIPCDWHFENCVFEWGGRPDEEDDGTVAISCIGTGYSMLEYGEFINCVIKCTNTNHANHMIFQTHDNTDTNFSSIKRGEHIRFENCYFSVADGSTYAYVDLRQTRTSPTIKSFAEFINCSGTPLYAPSTSYNKNFVCTEEHS